MMIETPQRIEPVLLEETVPSSLLDLATEIASAAARLERSLHPRTAAGLAAMVRIVNCYYSNLIEGHNTRPRDIEAALADGDQSRDLLIEARAHVRVQAEIDDLHRTARLPEPAGVDFICWLHRRFYDGASAEMLTVEGAGARTLLTPGALRKSTDPDIAVGRHMPPSGAVVLDFMKHFESRCRFAPLGKGARILAIAATHHRLNYIHPFLDGNGRVSRLMSHAMGHVAGIGAHGLWSVSRGLARGLESRTEYKLMMDHADTPRQGDRDGRGNLSEQALVRFSEWFLRVCLDQIEFMAGLFEIETLALRLKKYVAQNDRLRPETARLLEEALVRGEIERGAITRITGLPERSARRVLADAVAEGLLESDTPKGRLSLRFPVKAQDVLFPRLFPET